MLLTILFSLTAGMVQAEAFPYDISAGWITINSSNKTQWDGAWITGTINTIPSADDPFVKIENQHAAIVVDGVSLALTLNDLNVTGIQDNYLAKVSPILLRNGATLELTLKGENTLTACWGGAGICVPQGCTLTIKGDGKLTATGGNGGLNGYNDQGGAGIGMDDVNVNKVQNVYSGYINIKGGTIVAKGGSNTTETGGAAGIGGSAFVFAETIKISGGNVKATGAKCAAAIGGGIFGSAEVIIEGGTVEAISSGDGAAIGCGFATQEDYASSHIEIKGGTVIASGNIGHPKVCYCTGDNLDINQNNSDVICTGEITNEKYSTQTFTAVIYDGNLASQTGECGFRFLVSVGLFHPHSQFRTV